MVIENRSIVPFRQVDVFTDKPFFGNPVAVVFDADDLTEAEMRRIAAWTNLSETTFVLKPTLDDADYRLRIFTPRQELPFAGHPTIGSAYAVLEKRGLLRTATVFRQECPAGLIEITVERIGDSVTLFAVAPPAKVTEIEGSVCRQIAQSLQIETVITALRVDVGARWVVADMADSDRVENLLPDMALVNVISNVTDTVGITVFGATKDGSKAQYHVRSFAPGDGVPEDPVCGSGNISVAAYLRHHNRLADGSRYIARQGMSMGRDGTVHIRRRGDDIIFGGGAITCVEGTIRIK